MDAVELNKRLCFSRLVPDAAKRDLLTNRERFLKPFLGLEDAYARDAAAAAAAADDPFLAADGRGGPNDPLETLHRGQRDQ